MQIKYSPQCSKRKIEYSFENEIIIAELDGTNNAVDLSNISEYPKFSINGQSLIKLPFYILSVKTENEVKKVELLKFHTADAPVSERFYGWKETKFIEGEWVLEDVLEHATPISATPVATTPTFDDELQIIKNLKKEELNMLCQRTICSGFYSSALGEPHKYESKVEDQINLMGAVQLGIDMWYRCWNIEETKQEWYQHTAEQLKQVFIDGSMMVRANLERVSILKEQIDLLTDIEEINNIQW
jgi:hypothetical protein